MSNNMTNIEQEAILKCMELMDNQLDQVQGGHLPQVKLQSNLCMQEDEGAIDIVVACGQTHKEDGRAI